MYRFATVANFPEELAARALQRASRLPTPLAVEALAQRPEWFDRRWSADSLPPAVHFDRLQPLLAAAPAGDMSEVRPLLDLPIPSPLLLW